jgi:Ca2+-binding RTX toxin-like protein
MAVPAFHITNEESGNFGTTTPFDEIGPGTLLMDPDAFLNSETNTILMSGGPWTATIHGKVTSSDFDGSGGFAVTMGTNASFTPGNSLIVGATGEITGFNAVLGFSPINVTNHGRIVANITAIRQGLAGDCTIKNTGTIASSTRGIEFSSTQGGGTHTIVNSGLIEAFTAIENLSATGIERVTNSGTIIGNIDLGGGNDSFTDFAKVKVKGKLVTKQGTVDGIVDLGDGNDSFKGGNNAETVRDGQGADTYKLGGGNDILIAAPDTGSDGVDTIDGGAGIDTYDASSSTANFLINLDTKAHGGIAANSVVVSGQADHIFNFEDVHGGGGGGNADIIYGNAAANHIFAGGGADQIFGLGGNDVLVAGGQGSQLHGGDGNDTLDGGTGDNDFYGGPGRDILTAGNFSGQGAVQKIFHFESVTDSGVTAATRDIITDFGSGSGPGTTGCFIDLSVIDAIKGTPANDDFTFIGESKWHHVAGELRYVSTQTQTIVEADVNGDAKVDFSIALNGHHALTADDFIGVV